ncbi:MAG: hypothetical protein HZA19_04620 [Nitrospirae bacterium]|nr:hypothetical protein [Nitrospirota bacterium]
MAWVGGRTEDFSVQAMADGLRVTKMDSAGQWTSQSYSGNALDQISLKVARIMETQRMAAVSH